MSDMQEIEVIEKQFIMAKDKNGKFTSMPLSGLQLSVISDLIYTDKRPTEIFKSRNIPSSTYYSWFQNEKFISELEKERRRFFRAASVPALKKVIELMDSADSRTALRAAEKVLQECGHFKDQGLQVNSGNNITISLSNDEGEFYD